MNDNWESYFDNWNLLRREMFLEKRKFIQKNENKYQNQKEMRRAVERHINRKFSKISDNLFKMRFDMMMYDSIDQ